MSTSRQPRRNPRPSPTLVIAAIALVGSGIFLLYGITIRSKDQVPLLVTGAVVLGIVFAVAGGIAGMVALGCFAGALVLALMWGG